ncbi:MAG: purine-nucleoside phosphorylase [Campylobacterota bacterium]|nr:purine-nucleoside phosphorylase [Campylobacterota bacterium]
MIICAGDIEQFDFATPIGIGLVNTAINLTKLCLLSPPEFILFVGTAGSYGRHEIFDIVESRTAANIENGFFTHGAYTPLDNVISTAEPSRLYFTPTASAPSLQARDSSYLIYDPDVSRETIVNSSNYITTDPTLSSHYLKQNIKLENMEFFSILKVAQELNIPAGGVFIVTNYCDNDAHKSFVTNHKEAIEKLTLYMRDRLGRMQ